MAELAFVASCFEEASFWAVEMRGVFGGFLGWLFAPESRCLRDFLGALPFALASRELVAGAELWILLSVDMVVGAGVVLVRLPV